MRLRLATIAGLTIFLTSCMVGPNYTRPDVPTAPAYRGPDETSVSSAASLADQKWFEVFKDPVLQQLIRTALKQNFDVRIAATRILQQQEQVRITHSNQLPTVTGGPSVTGLRQPGVPGAFPSYAYAADALNINASWNLDFWGRYRRATEAARATLLADVWAQRAVTDTLIDNLATAYFQLREYDLELDLSKQTLATRKQSLQLTQTLEQGGNTSLVDVRQAEQLVEEAAEAIPQTEQNIEQEENQISILMGENPHSIPRGQSLIEQPDPDSVPAGLPSQLLERRPDIQEAEQTLVAANANIGVARAQLFPQISLTGGIGLENIGAGNLFTWADRSYNWTAQASQPIFNGGSLRANVRLSEDQKQQAVLTYQQDIQQAFRDVSNALIAYKKSREYREHQELLTQATHESSNLAQIRYKGGVTSYLEVLTNDTNYFSAELALARARLTERLSIVQLYNALGGGWQQ